MYVFRKSLSNLNYICLFVLIVPKNKTLAISVIFQLISLYIFLLPSIKYKCCRCHFQKKEFLNSFLLHKQIHHHPNLIRFNSKIVVVAGHYQINSSLLCNRGDVAIHNAFAFRFLQRHISLSHNTSTIEPFSYSIGKQLGQTLQSSRLKRRGKPDDFYCAHNREL